MSIRGVQAVGVGVIPFPWPHDARVLGIRAAIASPPLGSSLIYDVKKNGISIFTGLPLFIAAGASLSASIVPTVFNILAGDIYTVDTVQVGSTFAGANATIVLDVA